MKQLLDNDLLTIRQRVLGPEIAKLWTAKTTCANALVILPSAVSPEWRKTATNPQIDPKSTI